LASPAKAGRAQAAEMQAAPAVHDSMKLRRSMVDAVDHARRHGRTGFVPSTKVAMRRQCATVWFTGGRAVSY
jgi:hypothetical protein